MIDKMDFNKHFEGKVAWRHYRESPWGLVPEQSVLLSWHRRENHFFMKTSILTDVPTWCSVRFGRSTFLAFQRESVFSKFPKSIKIIQITLCDFFIFYSNYYGFVC